MKRKLAHALRWPDCSLRCPRLTRHLGKSRAPGSPASMSIHEKATVFAEGPMMGVFNNLVILDHHVKQNSLETIVIWPLADAWKSSG